MSLPVLIAFAGVLVAAVVTGLLAGRCARQPSTGLVLWTAATLALTIALAVQSLGFDHGFNPAMFRAVQLFGLLFAPLWLAWGLAELVWPSEAARFGARLICIALTVVGGVILATDPLTGPPFKKSWPLASVYYQPVSHYALDVTQAAAVVIAVSSVGLAVSLAKNDPRRSGILAATAAVGLAVLMTAGLRFSLPARSVYPLVATLAAVLVWFGATRIGDGPARAGRDHGAEEADGYDVPDAQYAYATNGHHRPVDPAGLVDPGGLIEPPDYSRGPGGPGGPGRPGAPYGPRGTGEPGAPRGPGEPRGPGGPGLRQQPAPPGPPARPYGRIVIFTLLEDRVADFDRLADQTAEEVRTREPGTLVFVIHLVPNAPLQRIFYEIYRDQDAFDSHESQPYTQRFAAERRSCVLATNIIELRLKYAKVAPLPGPPPASPLPASPLPASPQAAGPQVLDPLPPRPDRRQPAAPRRYGGT